MKPSSEALRKKYCDIKVAEAEIYDHMVDEELEWLEEAMKERIRKLTEHEESIIMAKKIAVMTRDFGTLKKDQEYEVREVKTHTTMVFDGAGDILAVPNAFVTVTGGTAKAEVAEGVGVEMSEDEIDVLSALLDDDEIEMGAAISPTGKSPETKEEPKEKLEDGKVWFSEVAGKLPTSKLDHIISIYPDDHFPEDIRCDIPDPDPHFIWEPDALEMLYFAHKLNKKCLLTGYPGTGKSSAIKQFASLIRQPYMRFNGKDGIEPSSFLGYPWAAGAKEGMIWKDGLLPIGLKNNYLVTIDEVFKLPAGIQMAMQCLYEDGGYLILDDKPGTLEEKRITPGDDFRLFMTDNVKGTGDDFDKFAATQLQDTSTLDRFTLTVELEYLPEKDEKELLKKKFKMSALVAGKLVRFAGLVRAGYKNGELGVTLSPRGLFTIAELMNEGLPVIPAIQLAYANKLGEDAEKLAVKTMMDTVKFT